MISPRSVQESALYYQEKLKKYGSSAEGMDWKNRDTQYLRFDMILRYIDFSHPFTVLDVGCGDGEFLAYCRTKNLEINYKGIDAVPEMAVITNERFGNDTATHGEFLTSDSTQQFDYVIASGTFNAKLATPEEEWRSYFFANIEKMWSLSKKATIFNCMTTFVDYRYDRLFYARPDELGALAVTKLSRHFIIDHSYPLYEMTMAVFKNEE